VEPQVFEKSDAAKAMIREAIKGNMLFNQFRYINTYLCIYVCIYIYIYIYIYCIYICTYTLAI
jgi:hypothetical protein